MANRIITHRRCCVCQQTKPITEFYSSKVKNSAGFMYSCKECCKAKSKASQRTEKTKERDRLKKQERRANDPSYKEYSNESVRKWREKNPAYKPTPRSSETNLRHRLRNKFKLSLDDYYKLVEQQQNRCAICGDPPPYQRLVVDHDHSCCVRQTSCGKCLRGLLCPRCNAGLGAFKDNETILLKAINYLSNYR